MTVGAGAYPTIIELAADDDITPTSTRSRRTWRETRTMLTGATVGSPSTRPMAHRVVGVHRWYAIKGFQTPILGETTVPWPNEAEPTEEWAEDALEEAAELGEALAVEGEEALEAEAAPST